MLLCFALQGSFFSCLLSIWLYHSAVSCVVCLLVCCLLSGQRAQSLESGHSPFGRCSQTDGVSFDFSWQCKPLLHQFCLCIILVLVRSCQLTSSSCLVATDYVCFCLSEVSEARLRILKDYFSGKIFSV